jgi:Uma2 family endonuclease
VFSNRRAAGEWPISSAFDALHHPGCAASTRRRRARATARPLASFQPTLVRTTFEMADMTIAAEMLFTPFDQYLALEAASDVKHEWINGLVYAMSRGTPEHGRLSAAIVRALPQTGECRVYSSDTLLYVEQAQHSTYADASIVCGAILTRGAKDKNGKSLGEAITNPSVIVEVLSKSTEQHDRNERFVVFQQIDSLEEYVLISQEERRIEVRRRAGRNWTLEVKGAGETVRIHGLDIAIDAIYA